MPDVSANKKAVKFNSSNKGASTLLLDPDEQKERIDLRQKMREKLYNDDDDEEEQHLTVN